jgi:hypothetical protein
MTLRVLVALFVLMGLCSISLAAEAAEQVKIDASLGRMEKSDLIFIRNGSEYAGKAAADHMRSKLKHAGDAVRTFEDFVEKIATKSSMSGKPYLVKFKDGSTVELAKWLREKP